MGYQHISPIWVQITETQASALMTASGSALVRPSRRLSQVSKLPPSSSSSHSSNCSCYIRLREHCPHLSESHTSSCSGASSIYLVTFLIKFVLGVQMPVLWDFFPGSACSPESHSWTFSCQRTNETLSMPSSGYIR